MAVAVGALPKRAAAVELAVPVLPVVPRAAAAVRVVESAAAVSSLVVRMVPSRVG
jgi:hypothetical protein